MANLNEEKLNKVAGGEVTFGDKDIVKCDGCGNEYDLDSATPGTGIMVGNLNDPMSSTYRPTCICPICNEEHTYTYVQKKLPSLNNHAKIG